MNSTRHLLFVVVVVMFTTSGVHAQTLSTDCDNLRFFPHTITTALDQADSVFAADLDGDGDIDVLSAYRGENKIAWYENTDGLGSFGPQHIITTAAIRASSVFAADLDGDGDFDVLSASRDDDKIAWYENVDGLGTFGPQQVITTSADVAVSVFAADVDGDGDTDVLSASSVDDKIAWYENTDGLGTFGPQQVITTAANRAITVFTADLDGDGDTDVLSASGGDDKIAWYENTDGLGTFGPQQVIDSAAFRASSIFAADLDGDGDIDVLSASRDDDKIAWYENTNGMGTFGLRQVITNNIDAAVSVFATDLDGDGDIDVLSASVFDNKIAWYENTNGLGTFGPQQVITSAADGARSVFAADLDGDGDTDVLSASQGDGKIAWYENIPPTDCNNNGVIDGCDLADGTSVDCNGNHMPDECDIDNGTSTDCNKNDIPDECDIVNGDCNKNGQVDECDIIFGTSADCNGNAIPDECDVIPEFSGSVITTEEIAALSMVFAADLDGDGDFDVLSASQVDNKIAWYENTDGLGNFGSQQIITDLARSVFSVYAADMDGDGDIDVLSASPYADHNNIAWYENTDGLGIFGPRQVITITTLGHASFISATDLDHDGDYDILFVFHDFEFDGSGNFNITWFENIDGLGNFGPQLFIATELTGALRVHAADFDGDGDTDVLSSSSGDDKIAWYENIDGLGTFGPQKVIATATTRAVTTVFATDIDGDGDTDVLSAYSNLSLDVSDDKIVWFENTDGLGTFGPQQVITTDAFHATSVFATDLDGDSDTDVLSTSSGNKIAWYENTDGLGTFGPPQIITIDTVRLKFAFPVDLDGDGDTDILSASSTSTPNWDDNKIAWYENILSVDCNENNIPDECDIVNASSLDCNNNEVPDECEDCCVDLDCEDDSDVCTDEVCVNGVCTHPENNVCGACCEQINGFCMNRVPPTDCTGNVVFAPGTKCNNLDPICTPISGACCNTRFGTCTNTILAQCSGTNLNWTKGENCSAQNCPDPFIPTVSVWGLLMLTLLLLIGAKIYFNRREKINPIS